MFKRCLIANRGEIAVRIARTCERMGVEPVAVHSRADRNSYHVRQIGRSVELGGAPARESYLNMDAVVAAARNQQCDAVHPGYGFLSENPAFARLLAAEKIAFVGPNGATLARCGDKAAAKTQAQTAGLPVLGGSLVALDETSKIIEAAETIGFPVMLKAATGGGGRGMRVVHGLDGIEATIESARREAASAFGDAGLIVEQWIERARHIEVQVAGDCHGSVVHLFERECSLQRRHQKVVEEAPAPNLSLELRNALTSAAVLFVESLEYQGVGTVEFLVADSEFWFLEMNPRLQVEHPVTEEVTGIDLVEWQLRLAAGEPMPLAQESVRLSGHAVEARLYAEDPAAGFLPSAGLLDEFKIAGESLRLEQGVEAGDEVTTHYDPMLAKLIARGSNRAEALLALQSGLAGSSVGGVESNLQFLQKLLRQPEVQSGEFWTRLIDERLQQLQGEQEAVSRDESLLVSAVGGFFWLRSRLQHGGESAPSDPWTQWGRMTGWRFATEGGSVAGLPSVEVSDGDRPAVKVAFGALTVEGNETTLALRIDGEVTELLVADLADGSYRIAFRGVHHLVRVTLQENQLQIEGLGPRRRLTLAPYVTTSRPREEGAALLRAPMMGQIMTLNVAVGDTVAIGDVVAVLESMKMEIPLPAPEAGVITAVHCSAGGAIERGSLIAEIEPA